MMTAFEVFDIGFWLGAGMMLGAAGMWALVSLAGSGVTYVRRKLGGKNSD